MDRALETIDRWIERRECHYVCVTGVHGVMESQRDEALRDIHNNAGLVTPDGMPLVWLSRLRGLKHVERVYGPDLMLACCARSLVKGHTHFFYGGPPGIAEQLASRLCEQFPGLAVAGWYSPPFHRLNPSEDEEIVRRIDEAAPDIVWVGLSTPKQERWMHDHLGRLKAPAMIGVGAAFDFVSGTKRQAPAWMRRNGLEWLFRLASEPRRLWRRYLVNNPLFVWEVLLQTVGARRYDLPEC